MIKGLLIFNVDVGQLPPDKAEALLLRIKDDPEKKSLIKSLKKQGWELIWVPQRNMVTSITKIVLD